MERREGEEKQRSGVCWGLVERSEEQRRGGEVEKRTGGGWEAGNLEGEIQIRVR